VAIVPDLGNGRTD
jgi:uncharacterized membrane protein